jgi:hypothetical protein
MNSILQINIQYMYIIGKYKIYLCELSKQVEKWVFGEYFSSVCCECKSIWFLRTMYVCCVHPAIEKCPNITEERRNKHYTGYTATFSYNSLFTKQVQTDCYLYIRWIKQIFIHIHVPLLYSNYNDCWATEYMFVFRCIHFINVPFSTSKTLDEPSISAWFITDK